MSDEKLKLPIAMDLDEAIDHAAEKGRHPSRCGEEHRQLADWLRELRERRSHSTPRGSAGPRLGWASAGRSSSSGFAASAADRHRLRSSFLPCSPDPAPPPSDGGSSSKSQDCS